MGQSQSNFNARLATPTGEEAEAEAQPYSAKERGMRFGAVSVKVTSLVPNRGQSERIASYTVYPRGAVFHAATGDPDSILEAISKQSSTICSLPEKIQLQDSRVHDLLIMHTQGWHAFPSPEVFSRHSGTCQVVGDRSYQHPPVPIKLGDCFRLGSVGIVVSEIKSVEGAEQRLDSKALQYLRDEAVAFDIAEEEACLAADEGGFDLVGRTGGGGGVGGGGDGDDEDGDGDNSLDRNDEGGTNGGVDGEQVTQIDTMGSGPDFILMQKKKLDKKLSKMQSGELGGGVSDEEATEVNDDDKDVSGAGTPGLSASNCGHSKPVLSKFFCYMCYESHDTAEDPLVAPCQCRGDTRYLHVQCLQRWYQSTGSGVHAQVIRTTGNGAPACKICGAAYKTVFRNAQGKKVSLLEMNSNGPYITLIVVTKHDTNPGLFNTRFRLNFSQEFQTPNAFATEEEQARSVSISIGRSSTCNMVVDYRTVSTRHAKIYYENGQFLLQDQRSSNGTMLYLREPLALPYDRLIKLRMGRSTLSVEATQRWGGAFHLFSNNSALNGGAAVAGQTDDAAQSGGFARRGGKIMSSVLGCMSCASSVNAVEAGAHQENAPQVLTTADGDRLNALTAPASNTNNAGGAGAGPGGMSTLPSPGPSFAIEGQEPSGGEGAEGEAEGGSGEPVLSAADAAAIAAADEESVDGNNLVSSLFRNLNTTTGQPAVEKLPPLPKLSVSEIYNTLVEVSKRPQPQPSRKVGGAGSGGRDNWAGLGGLGPNGASGGMGDSPGGSPVAGVPGPEGGNYRFDVSDGGSAPPGESRNNNNSINEGGSPGPRRRWSGRNSNSGSPRLSPRGSSFRRSSDPNDPDFFISGRQQRRQILSAAHTEGEVISEAAQIQRLLLEATNNAAALAPSPEAAQAVASSVVEPATSAATGAAVNNTAGHGGLIDSCPSKEEEDRTALQKEVTTLERTGSAGSAGALGNGSATHSAVVSARASSIMAAGGGGSVVSRPSSASAGNNAWRSASNPDDAAGVNQNSTQLDYDNISTSAVVNTTLQRPCSAGGSNSHQGSSSAAGSVKSSPTKGVGQAKPPMPILPLSGLNAHATAAAAAAAPVADSSEATGSTNHSDNVNTGSSPDRAVRNAAIGEGETQVARKSPRVRHDEIANTAIGAAVAAGMGMKVTEMTGPNSARAKIDKHNSNLRKKRAAETAAAVEAGVEVSPRVSGGRRRSSAGSVPVLSASMDASPRSELVEAQGAVNTALSAEVSSADGTLVTAAANSANAAAAPPDAAANVDAAASASAANTDQIASSSEQAASSRSAGLAGNTMNRGEDSGTVVDSPADEASPAARAADVTPPEGVAASGEQGVGGSI